MSFNINCYLNSKARFKRRTFHVPNAIQTIDNEIYQLINYCLNCIRHVKSSTFKPGLNRFKVYCLTTLLDILPPWKLESNYQNFKRNPLPRVHTLSLYSY